MEVLKGKTIQDGWGILKDEVIKVQTQTIPKRKKNGNELIRPVWWHKELSEK